jgi:multiple sugar transport system ATP-binding protein
MARVALENIEKRYGSRPAVTRLDLVVEHEEFVVLVGPSGCGKSTTLRLVAGLEAATTGVIRIGDRIVNHLAPKDRDIAMVFQNYALYQHMTVYDNLAFGLRNRRTAEPIVRQEISRAAEILGLTDLLERRPRELSGGQQQRVALGRCIVRHPSVFLFDEPLSNLDAELRAQMRIELKRLRQRIAATSVYVTHDQVEAMTLGDRVAVMREGRIQQVGAPLEIYDRPQNRFVAGFIGSPAMNFLDVKLEQQADECYAVASNLRIRIPPERAVRLGNRTLTLGVRPERVLLADVGAEAGSSFDAVVEVTEQLGTELVLGVRAGGHALIASRIDPHAQLALDQPVRLSLDPRGLHFFDRSTGAALR